MEKTKHDIILENFGPGKSAEMRNIDLCMEIYANQKLSKVKSLIENYKLRMTTLIGLIEQEKYKPFDDRHNDMLYQFEVEVTNMRSIISELEIAIK